MMGYKWGSGTIDLRTAFEELERIRQQMDKLFGDLAEGAIKEPTLSAGVFPLVNLSENNDNYYVRAELPGVKAEDLDISVTANSLIISGERKIPEEENVNYHRREREAGRFSRVISLPGQIEPEKVEAKCKNGILTIILPKAETSKTRQVAIKTE